MKQWPVLFSIFLVLMFILIVPVNAETWSRNTNGGIKIIKINTNDANWEVNLKNALESRGPSKNVLITVHGVTSSAMVYTDQKAIQTDLLERDQRELPIVNDRVRLNLNAHGFASLKFIPF